MPMPPGAHLQFEFERLEHAILSAEEWAPGYSDAPDEHQGLLKMTARLERQMMIYFRDLAKQSYSFIDWYAYARAVIENKHAMKGSGVQAYDVNVIVNQQQVNDSDQTFIRVVFDTVNSSIALGAKSMETEHGLPTSLTRSSTIVQQLTTKQLANLVGMKVNKDGTIVPNPNPEYDIDETTRTKIADSIKTSIQLGENQQEAAARLNNVIANPVRAQAIARTETVRAYANGRAEYANQSNAQGKYWQVSGAVDECLDNVADGTIPVSQAFSTGNMSEPVHPNCRCQTKYVYNLANPSS